MLSKLLAALLLLIGLGSGAFAAPTPAELARWQRHAQRVTITRDDWGIAHVRGRSDADAVFGMIYAQAEDDFNRVETNYLTSLGRLAEAEGEKAIFQDLRMKLFIDPADLRKRYAASPAWLRRLMDAWADGLNHYLHSNPQVRPRVITRFEPWMALSFSEGSIGGDIERISLIELEEFYGNTPIMTAAAAAKPWQEPSGSNGIAIAPAISAGRNALLLINPHTSFFFRSELQMQSEEGLNAYGAATWGQFFIYQGFNDRLGWMHTSSGVDVVDEFVERIVRRGGWLFYRYGKEERPVTIRALEVPFRKADGTMGSRSFQVYSTHHGPIVRDQGGDWVSAALMHKPVEALSQSYLRTKARDLRSFMKVMELKANSSNNTIYADADGNIVYLHPQFIPRRDDRFDYTKPVDGSDPATDWQGLHGLSEAPQVRNPATGWIMNTNNWPYSAAGANSPRRELFPRYMDTFGENARGVHAIKVLEGRRDFTLPSLIAAAYDPYLPAFAQLVPALVSAWDGLPAADPLKARLAGQVALLRGWDYRWGVASMPTSLAVFWGEALWDQVPEGVRAGRRPDIDHMEKQTSAEQKLRALATASERLERDFGSWGIAWGEINRFQRLTGDIVQPFSDARPSLAVPFTSGVWGSLASFGARPYPGTKRYYGTSGNSFVAVVEFGKRVKARAVSAGGESGNPSSPHFNDQAERYSLGNLRQVYFHPDELQGHVQRRYRPGGGEVR
jgi:acyl-homoserine-lactone acylase